MVYFTNKNITKKLLSSNFTVLGPIFVSIGRGYTIFFITVTFMD